MLSESNWLLGRGIHRTPLLAQVGGVAVEARCMLGPAVHSKWRCMCHSVAQAACKLADCLCAANAMHAMVKPRSFAYLLNGA